jgi:hypothetical protein
MLSDLYIYKKEIDWSALHLELNIPISLQDIFYQNLKLRLKSIRFAHSIFKKGAAAAKCLCSPAGRSG